MQAYDNNILKTMFLYYFWSEEDVVNTIIIYKH